MKRALITGVFGQDGSYLTELLFQMGYEVHGIAREPLSRNSARIQQYLAKKGIEPIIHVCDLNSYPSVRYLMKVLEPSECYHLAAAHYSSQLPEGNAVEVNRDLYQNNVVSALNTLYAIHEVSPDTKMVLAGSCLMYDATDQSPQNETIPYASNSIYGLSKIAGDGLLKFFRESFHLHLSTAVLYNHESPRRPEHFVSKKIVTHMVGIASGRIGIFEIDNLNSVRDWGYAKDYVYGMWLMCQRDRPKDYILATGEGHSVGDFLARTAEVLEIKDWRDHVRATERIRKSVRVPLVGDPTLARTDLNWERSIDFEELVELMVDNELRGGLD